MFIKTRPEFQYMKKQDQNSSVYKNRARIPVFGRIRSEFQCV